MKVRSFFLCAWFIANLVVFAREEAGGDKRLSLDALRARLTSHLSQNRFRHAQWGIKVVSVESGATVFDHEAGRLLKPASTAKLFTGALALDVLTPDFRIETSLYAARKPQGGVLSGDLVVFGRGDPSFSSTFLDAGANPLGRLVQAIREAGIQKVEGDLVADASYFAGPPMGSGWTWDDLQYYYGAEVTALCVDDNVLDLVIRPGLKPGDPCSISLRQPAPGTEVINHTRTGAQKSLRKIEVQRALGENRVTVEGVLPLRGEAWSDSVSISDAPLRFAQRLREELIRGGVAVTGQARALQDSGTETSRLVEVGETLSPPIAEIVTKMMKLSQNLYAQLLLLQTGARRPAAPGVTTEELGLKQLNEFLARAGIPGDEVLLDDGAGLSRSALVTPAAMVQLLRYMAKHKYSAEFRNSLPEAGIDGTLQARLKGLQGRLWAKTGTIRYVNTLAGYVKTGAGEELAFSIMLNAYSPPAGSSGRDDIDAILLQIAQLAERAHE